MEFMVNPKDAKKAGLKDGDWAEVANQFSRCQGVVNVTDEVQPGLISAHLRLAGPQRQQPVRRCRSYYANNLVAGGDAAAEVQRRVLQEHPRALRKLKRAPRTAEQHARAVREGRASAAVNGPGEDGNPDSKAKNFVSRQL